MSGEITIYTDGASSGNPGPGGYGVVMISGRHRLEKSEGFSLTTNNRMELLAVIAGLYTPTQNMLPILLIRDGSSNGNLKVSGRKKTLICG
jgi:ribonuclease HI